MTRQRKPRSERVYGVLLQCYPREFRERFGDGMMSTFVAEARDARARGASAYASFWLRSAIQAVVLGMLERLPGSGGREALLGRGLFMDLSHAVRRLRRSPGFTSTATLTLALGIGATVAMFSLVKGVVLNPLAYPEADRLVAVQHSAEGAGIPVMGVSFGTYVHYRDLSEAFEEMAVYTPRSYALLGDEGAQRIPGASVTQGFFEIFLDGGPQVGRAIGGRDQAPGAPRVAMISDELWRSRFGAEPAVVGRTVVVGGNPVEVVGVLPPGFDVPSERTQIWLAERLDPEAVILGGFGRSGVGRLRPGVTPEQAEAELRLLMPRLADRFNPVAFDLLVTGGRLEPVVTPLREYVVGDVSQMLWILLGTVAFVLGIACANVANLFLVRAETHGRETAVRTALGAGRRRIVRHHLVESLMLAALGGLGGVFLAELGVRWVVAAGPRAIPRLHEIEVGGAALVLAASLSVGAGLLFGLIPTLKGRGAVLAELLADGGRGNTAGRARHRARSALVVTQISLAMVLLVGAGLMVRTFWHLRSVDPGMDTESALVFQVGLPEALYPDRDEALRFQQQILERMRALPGAVAAGATVCLPFDGCDGRTPVYPADMPVEAGVTPPSVDVRGATSGYFEAVGAPLIEGRTFEADDPFESPPAAVVSRNLAERAWPGESPIGKRIYPDYPEEEPYTVVGVVGDVRSYSLAEDAPEMLYVSFLGPYGYVAPPHTLTFVVKTEVPPLSLAPSVRTVVADLDPNVPISNLRTFEDVLERASAPTAFAMILLVGAGLSALALGAVGVYGVLSYSVGQRTSEIGVRIAMGAEAGQVGRMILRQGAVVLAIGLAAGLAGAVVLTRVMGAVLYGVSSFDPVTYVAVSVGLGVVALGAGYLPARRASSVDPITALRGE